MYIKKLRLRDGYGVCIKWSSMSFVNVPQGGAALKSVLLLMLNPSVEIATMATTLAHKVRQ